MGGGVNDERRDIDAIKSMVSRGKSSHRDTEEQKQH
jgi:hypothetical protein